MDIKMTTHRHLLYLLVVGVLLILLPSCSEETDQTTLLYRMALRVEDDGWVYVFDNQYLEGMEDFGSNEQTIYPFNFKGVNLRYRYDENYTTQLTDNDSYGNAVTRTVLQSTLWLGNSDSQIERHDMDIIADLLGYEREGTHKTTSELLELTPADLEFDYIDGEMFVSLLRECLTSENKPAGKYLSIPSWALFTEPKYLDDYKFQIGLIGGYGTVEIIMFDVLYRTGDGLTDYVQLYDLVRDGKASDEQIQLLNVLQDIEAGVVENNDLQYMRNECDDDIIAGVSLSRLYDMLKNIEENNYADYVVHPQ